LNEHPIVHWTENTLHSEGPYLSYLAHGLGHSLWRNPRGRGQATATSQFKPSKVTTTNLNTWILSVQVWANMHWRLMNYNLIHLPSLTFNVVQQLIGSNGAYLGGGGKGVVIIRALKGVQLTEPQNHYKKYIIDIILLINFGLILDSFQLNFDRSFYIIYLIYLS